MSVGGEVGVTRIAVLAHIRDLEEWVAQGWNVATGPAHPVQRGYGRCYVWKWA